jgi:hypothetical protein
MKSHIGHVPHSLENITGFFDENKVIHYTCNAPSEEVLDRNNVQQVGHDYGCANNKEVVIMTRYFLEKILSKEISGDPSLLVLDCENALRKMK